MSIRVDGTRRVDAATTTSRVNTLNRDAFMLNNCRIAPRDALLVGVGYDGPNSNPVYTLRIKRGGWDKEFWTYTSGGGARRGDRVIFYETADWAPLALSAEATPFAYPLVPMFTPDI